MRVKFSLLLILLACISSSLTAASIKMISVEYFGADGSRYGFLIYSDGRCVSSHRKAHELSITHGDGTIMSSGKKNLKDSLKNLFKAAAIAYENARDRTAVDDVITKRNERIEITLIPGQGDHRTFIRTRTENFQSKELQQLDEWMWPSVESMMKLDKTNK